MKSSIEYTLIDPIELEGGDLAENVIINAPRGKDKRLCMILESIYYQALKNNVAIYKDVSISTEDAEDAKKEDGSESGGLMSQILMGGNREIVGELLNTFCEIIISGNKNDPIATIDGVKFTVPLFDQLSPNDTKELIGRYISSFLSVT